MLKFIKRHKALISFFILVILIFFLRFQILSAIGAFLVINNPLVASDVVHAPSGPGNRELYAINLYKEQYAKNILFTGGVKANPPAQSPYSKKVKEYSVGKGVRPESIFVSGSSSTYEGSVALKRLVLQKDFGSAIVVSSPYHMRRVRMVFNKVVPDKVQLVFHHVPWEMSELKKKWWTDEKSIEFVVTEYVKLVYYYFRYIL